MNKKAILRIKQQKITEVIGLLVTVVAGLIMAYSQSRDPQTGIIMFLALLGAIIVYFLISYPIGIFSEKIYQLNRNSEAIETIKKDLNNINIKLELRKAVEDLNVRISTLENLLKMKGKSGAVDPRWVVILIILLLLYLYLKSKGIIQ